MRNNVFPTFHRRDLTRSSSSIAIALKEFGAVYIDGFEDQVASCKAEFLSKISVGKSEVLRLTATESVSRMPRISEILYSKEFDELKFRYLGRWFRSNIEMFAQNTEFTNNPPSGELHFDRRQTFKIWIYFNEVGPAQGPMRVVPNSILGDYGTLSLRKSFGLRDLFDQSLNVHRPPVDLRSEIESRAQQVTGPEGTLFVHDTDAWHGASEVKVGCRRWIARSHHRPFKDHFVR